MLGLFVVNKHLLFCEDFVTFECGKAHTIIEKASYIFSRVDKLLNEYLCTDYYHSSTLSKHLFFNDYQKDQKECDRDIIPIVNHAMLGLLKHSFELIKMTEHLEFNSHSVHEEARLCKQHLLKISDLIHLSPELKHTLFDKAFSDVYPARLGDTFYPLVNLLPLPDFLARDLVEDIDTLVSDVDKVLLASSELSSTLI